MHNHAQFVPLEIDTIIANAKSVQRFAAAFEFSESLQFRAHNLLRQSSKLAKNVQLEILGHSRQFGCARWIENDLERPHNFDRQLKLWSIWIGSAYGNRTRLSALRGPCPN